VVPYLILLRLASVTIRDHPSVLTRIHVNRRDPADWTFPNRETINVLSSGATTSTTTHGPRPI
jgi:hypothetical protein|tara:strand:+ start:462 stop:650 length:189 start_codon:yes stop_codon:yes gene_type:complete